MFCIFTNTLPLLHPHIKAKNKKINPNLLFISHSPLPSLPTHSFRYSCPLSRHRSHRRLRHPPISPAKSHHFSSSSSSLLHSRLRLTSVAGTPPTTAIRQQKPTPNSLLNIIPSPSTPANFHHRNTSGHRDSPTKPSSELPLHHLKNFFSCNPPPPPTIVSSEIRFLFLRPKPQLPPHISPSCAAHDIPPASLTRAAPCLTFPPSATSPQPSFHAYFCSRPKPTASTLSPSSPSLWPSRATQRLVHSAHPTSQAQHPRLSIFLSPAHFTFQPSFSFFTPSLAHLPSSLQHT